MHLEFWGWPAYYAVDRSMWYPYANIHSISIDVRKFIVNFIIVTGIYLLYPLFHCLFVHCTLTHTRQSGADDKLKMSQKRQKLQDYGIWWLYLETPCGMHSNKYKHAWYWFRKCVKSWEFWETKRFCMNLWNKWLRAKYCVIVFTVITLFAVYHSQSTRQWSCLYTDLAHRRLCE